MKIENYLISRLYFFQDNPAAIFWYDSAMLTKLKVSAFELKERFGELALELVDLASTINIKILPYQVDSLPHFSRLKEEQMLSAIEVLDNYVGIFKRTVEKGYRVNESKMVTWLAIKSLGLTPSSDLFHYIEEDSVIEIYNAENIQIFRNLKFFEFCSYTLDDIFCRPWPSLYRRVEALTEEILTLKDRIYAENRLKTYKVDHIPPHEVQEVDSAFRYKIKTEGKYVSTLFDSSKRIKAVVVVENASLASPPLSMREQEECLKEYYARNANDSL